MSVPIRTLDEFQRCFPQVMGRADRPAGQVGPAVLTLAGAILWMKDPGPIEVRASPGGTASMAWVTFGGARYTFRYDPHARRIEVRSGSGSGDLLLEVSDGTDPSEIMAFVGRLGGRGADTTGSPGSDAAPSAGGRG